MSDRSKVRALHGGKAWQRFNKLPTTPKNGRRNEAKHSETIQRTTGSRPLNQITDTAAT